MNKYNVRCQTGQAYQALTVEQLKALAAAGMIALQDEINPDGSDQWVVASKVKGLFPVEAAEATTPPPTTASGHVPDDAVKTSQPPMPPALEGDGAGDDNSDSEQEEDDDEESEMLYSVKTTENVQFGPVDLNQLRVWVNERRVSPEDTIIFEDDTPPVIAGNWTPLKEYFKGVGGDDVISTIIPYKNKCALIGYYLGLFSILPVLGLPMGIAALVLGVKGLRYRAENPQAHGKGHSIVAIIGGSIGLLINLFIWVGMLGIA
jgi:hypothetical protein